MTGPKYSDERMQELAEDNSYLKSRLREAEIASASLAAKMQWTPADWDVKLQQALEAESRERRDRVRLMQELAETKQALEDALHDAKRWRKIAEDASHKGCEVTTDE